MATSASRRVAGLVGRAAAIAGCALLLSGIGSRPAAAAAPGGADYLRPFDVPVSDLAAAMECSPARHPEHERVLLVHGTSVTADENWAWNYELALPAAGFDWCTVQIPTYELQDVQLSAEYAVFAIRSTAALAHGKIAVIGLSQGPLEPRWALRWWPDTRDLVSRFISMAGTNHGVYFADAGCAGGSCIPALWQQTHVLHSNFLAALNTPAETFPGIAYTSVYSLTDDIIQPAAPTPTAALAGASNIAVQDICPGRVATHVQSAWDAAYYAVVLDALTHTGPADPARVDRSFCAQMGMPFVDPVTGWTNDAMVYVLAGERQTPYPHTSSEPPLRDYVTSGAIPPGAVAADLPPGSHPRRAAAVLPAGAEPVVAPAHAAAAVAATPDTAAVAPGAGAGLAVILAGAALRPVARRRAERRAIAARR